MRTHSGTIRNLFSGILMGIGCILPGVSGGVMAVSFGLYRPMLDAVLGFFHAPGRHLRFLMPIAAGGALGMLMGALGLTAALQTHRTALLMLFTGFILGGIPQLLREAEQKGRFEAKWLWAMLAGIALALPLAVLPGQAEPAAALTPLQSFAAGMLEGVGTVVPGISTSLVLLRLGWYDAYLSAFSALALERLILMGAGFALTAFASMRAVKALFDRLPGYAYCGVLGFLLVSVALVFPGFSAWTDGLMLAAGAVAAGWINRTPIHIER